MSVLVIADHEHGQLRPSTLNAVTAAQALGGDVHILVAGDSVDAVAKQAAQVAGVSKVLTATSADFANQIADALAPTIAKLSDGYEATLMSGTSTGKNLLPRVAALLDTAMLSDVTAIDGKKFTRPVYAGNALATFEVTSGKLVLTIRPTAFAAAAATGGSASIEAATAQSAGRSAKFVSREESKSERPELAGAKIVVSGGRGLGSAENFKLVEDIADKLGAAVGASRAAVDAGYVPNDYQVGQTGKVVAPQLYIAVGISGAIQHLAGMKDSKVIVAINKDPEAPIFNIADYGLVGDLFEILPELKGKL